MDELNVTPVISPEQMVSSPEVEPTGEGLTVTSDMNVEPTHPSAEVGVIV